MLIDFIYMTRNARPSALPRFVAFAAALMISAVTSLAAGTNNNENRGVGPASVAEPTAESERVAAELGVGRWIWTTNFAYAQQCRFWRAFTLPQTNAVRKANLRITADNFYRLYLDGREIAMGAEWKKLTDYDVTWLMSPGTHVLGIETLNDGFQGALILGLRIEYADKQMMQISSDRSWYVVPNNDRRWLGRTHPEPFWTQAQEVGVVGQVPWIIPNGWPYRIDSPPPLRPLELRFWQRGWFLSTVLVVCVVALGLSVRLTAKLAVQTRAQKLLERERLLIARDIHDDLGSSLTQLVLQGEVAQTELPENSPARAKLDDLCERARIASQALDEVLWAVNSKRDTLRDFSTYVCKYAQNFLAPTPIRCRLDVQPEMPMCDFDLPVRRGLFLAVKEALNNAAKHSGATELFLRISRDGEKVVVKVEDNGRGFDATLLRDGHGLGNMQQRLAEMGGEYKLESEPGAGCRVEFKMPLAHAPKSTSWRRWFGPRPRPAASGLEAGSVRGNDARVSEA